MEIRVAYVHICYTVAHTCVCSTPLANPANNKSYMYVCMYHMFWLYLVSSALLLQEHWHLIMVHTPSHTCMYVCIIRFECTFSPRRSFSKNTWDLIMDYRHHRATDTYIHTCIVCFDCTFSPRRSFSKNTDIWSWSIDTIGQRNVSSTWSPSTSIDACSKEMAMSDTCTYVVCVCIYIYIYIYISTCRQRWSPSTSIDACSKEMAMSHTCMT